MAIEGACALPIYERGAWIGSQPTLPTDSPGAGSYTTLMLPIDYSDRVGTPGLPAAQEAELRATEGLFEDLSSGRMDSSVVFASASPQWLRMPKPYSAYMELGQFELMNDALALARAQMGATAFAAVDFVGFLEPGSYRASAADPAFTANGKSLEGGYSAPLTASKEVHVHETMHLLGQPDLYREADGDTLTNGFDIMSGYRAMTPLAASQYRLEWILPNQVTCLKGSAPVTAVVAPMEASSLVVRKAVLVPLSSHRMLTVEVRNEVRGPAGCMDGVVISVADSAISTASGPVRVQSPSTGACPENVGGKAAAWPSGSTYTDAESGTTVAVGAKGSNGIYTVTVTPKPRYANTVLETSGLRGYWRLAEPKQANWQGLAPTLLKGRIHSSEGTTANAGYTQDTSGFNLQGSNWYDRPGAPVASNDSSQYFDGTRWITVPATASSATASLELWTRSDAGASTGYAFGSETGFKLAVGATSISAKVARGGSTSATALATTPSNAGTWVLWTLVADSSTLRVYRNGVQISSAPLTGTGTIAAGAGRIGALDGSNLRFKGQIDDVSVYDTALTSAEVLRHYQRGTQAP